MKVKALPRTDVVKNILQAELDSYDAKIGKANSELERLTKAGIFVGDTSISGFVDSLKQQRAKLEDKMTMLKSVSQPFTYVELELPID